jgi:protein phosphatase
MGTTLTLAYSVGFDVFVVHVGDSRAYLFREGKLERLTHDHTMAQRLADVGAIKPEEVPTHATRHVLTNFMGGPTHGVEPEVSTHRLRPGDILLLCTDGLTEMVGENEVAQLIRMASTLDDAVRALVHRALEKGGRDNVTVALARYEIAD